MQGIKPCVWKCPKCEKVIGHFNERALLYLKEQHLAKHEVDAMKKRAMEK